MELPIKPKKAGDLPPDKEVFTPEDVIELIQYGCDHRCPKIWEPGEIEFKEMRIP